MPGAVTGGVYRDSRSFRYVRLGSPSASLNHWGMYCQLLLFLAEFLVFGVSFIVVVLHVYFIDVYIF